MCIKTTPTTLCRLLRTVNKRFLQAGLDFTNPAKVPRKGAVREK